MSEELSRDEVQDSLRLLALLELFINGKEERIFSINRVITNTDDSLGRLVRDYIKLKIERVCPSYPVTLKKCRQTSRQPDLIYNIIFPSGFRSRELIEIDKAIIYENHLAREVNKDNAWRWLLEEELLKNGLLPAVSEIPGADTPNIGYKKINVTTLLTSHVTSLTIALNVFINETVAEILWNKKFQEFQEQWSRLEDQQVVTLMTEVLPEAGPPEEEINLPEAELSPMEPPALGDLASAPLAQEDEAEVLRRRLNELPAAEWTARNTYSALQEFRELLAAQTAYNA